MRNRVCRIFPILTLILLVLLFAACGETDSPEPGTVTETESESESESRERGPQVDISSLNSKMLGLTPYAVTSSDLYVSEGAVTSAGNLAVRSYEEGVALLTVSDYWGYTAEVTVTVSGAKAEIVVTKKFSQENVANVRMFGANGTGSGNDSEAFQKAIDSLPEEGGEVLVPAGVYPVSRLILKEGVHVRMQGKPDDVQAGYTEELAARVNGGKEFAVLRLVSGGNIFYNHDPGTSSDPLPGNVGVSHISVSGGVIDLNGAIAEGKVQIDLDMKGPASKVSGGAFVLSCGSDMVIEDVIMKDTYNGHAIQLTGVSDVTVRGCMFVGFVIRPEVAGSTSNIVLTRELIQIEYAHSGAIPPSSFEPGEFYYCKNVEISGCYFGESDKCAYPLTCIGQHGANLSANCTGLVIRGNVFDNPYYCALRLPNYVDVAIENNRFLSSTKGRPNGYFIELLMLNTDLSYDGTTKSGASATVIAAKSFEKAGLHNVMIRNNDFAISGASNKRTMNAVSTGYHPGAQSVSNIVKQVAGTFYGATYTGFLPCNDYIGNLTFSDNRVNVSSSSVQTDYTAIFSSVCGLTVENNSVTSSVSFTYSTGDQTGFRIGNEVSDEVANGLTILSSLQSNYILLPNGKGGTIRVNTDGNARTLLLTVPEHAHLSYQINSERNLEVTVTCEEGYAFSGWSFNGTAYPNSTATLSANVTLTAICEATVQPA